MGMLQIAVSFAAVPRLDGLKEMTMTKRIQVDDLPTFDAAPYLDSEAAIAAYLTDILEANDAALLTSAQEDIARARGLFGR
jgi:DNA-binding phage protein